MKKVCVCELRLLALLGGVVLVTSCGNVGEPQYPSLNIPVRITDLRAVELGNRILIDFTIPAVSTDGVVIKTVRAVELRCGDRDVPVGRNEPGPVHAEFPVDGLAGRDAVVHARVVGSKGHASDWSNDVTLHVVAPLGQASDLHAELVPEGVKVTWSASGAPHFRVYRVSENETTPTQIGESDAPSFVDVKTEYGKTYRYSVQGVNGTAQSEMSPISAPLTTKDIFPPAIPTGLTAAPGVNSAELAWERNTEPDFKCYRVYRSVDNGPFELIADNVEAPSYSDKTVVAGKHYRYTVAAVDQAGNTSQQSAPVEITL